MKLQVPFIQLPLLFDAEAMAAEIAALGEAPWRPHPNALPGNSMLPLIAVGGNPADEGFTGRMLPTPELLRCSYIMQVMASFGATLGRSRLMRLAGQAEVARHVDQGYYWAERARVHVPITTQPAVRFECGDAAINMAVGECWIFDTWRQHRVLNDDSSASRIHLVVDTVGGGDFWALVFGGRPHSAPTDGNWNPIRVMPKPDVVAELPCESINVPAVMSPWEINTHFGLLFGDTLPHPRLPVLRQHVQRLLRVWRGLWARFGEAPQGRHLYRQAMQHFVEGVRDPSEGMALNNELPWYSAMMTLIARTAVREDAADLDKGEYGIADRA